MDEPITVNDGTGANFKDSQFLRWLHVRMVLVYGEQTNTDFVRRLNDIAFKLEKRGE